MRSDLGDKSFPSNISGEGDNSATDTSTVSQIDSVQASTSDAITIATIQGPRYPAQSGPLDGRDGQAQTSASKGGEPVVLEIAEASNTSAEASSKSSQAGDSTALSPEQDSVSPVPTFGNNLVARLKSIDGPYIHHSMAQGNPLLASIPSLGDSGNLTRTANKGSQQLGRRPGSGKGSSTPPIK